MKQKKSKQIIEIIKKHESELQCMCDLDKWEPEPITGHSFVCPIHKAVTKECLDLLTIK
jgi:hypothetical protein